MAWFIFPSSSQFEARQIFEPFMSAHERLKELLSSALKDLPEGLQQDLLGQLKKWRARELPTADLVEYLKKLTPHSLTLRRFFEQQQQQRQRAASLETSSSTQTAVKEEESPAVSNAESSVSDAQKKAKMVENMQLLIKSMPLEGKVELFKGRDDVKVWLFSAFQLTLCTLHSKKGSPWPD